MRKVPIAVVTDQYFLHIRDNFAGGATGSPIDSDSEHGIAIDDDLGGAVT